MVVLLFFVGSVLVVSSTESQAVSVVFCQLLSLLYFNLYIFAPGAVTTAVEAVR